MHGLGPDGGVPEFGEGGLRGARCGCGFVAEGVPEGEEGGGEAGGGELAIQSADGAVEAVGRVEETGAEVLEGGLRWGHVGALGTGGGGDDGGGCALLN